MTFCLEITKQVKTKICFINKNRTLLCSCQLLSSPMGSRLLAPACRDALFLSHSQLHEVYKAPESSKIIQSRLCCLLDTNSTRPASTSTSAAASECSMPRRRGRSSITLIVSTKRNEDFHSQVNCNSKIVLAKWTSDFHSQVNSRCASKCTSDFHSESTQDVLESAPLIFTSKSTQYVLASAPLTLTHKSTQVSRRANQVHL